MKQWQHMIIALLAALIGLMDSTGMPAKIFLACVAYHNLFKGWKE